MREHRLVGADLPAVRDRITSTVEHLRSTMGEQAWTDDMSPALPEDDDNVLDNPCTCTQYRSESTHGARGTVFGDPGRAPGPRAQKAATCSAVKP